MTALEYFYKVTIENDKSTNTFEINENNPDLR